MLPENYAERVYAAVLGKCIGVRLGAPVEAENWTYERIRAVYGEKIHGYLRPYRVYGSDLFAQAVRMLYATDTPSTSAPPSMCSTPSP